MKKYITLFILLFIFPLTAYAENQVTINCESPKSNSEFECKVIANADFDVTGISLKYNISNTEFEEFKPSTDFQGEGIKNSIDLYTDTPIKLDNYELGILKLKSNKNFKELNINYLSLDYSDSNYDDHVIYNNVNQNDNSHGSLKIVILICVIILIVIIVCVLIKKRKVNK